jgi:MvaI/BcnI restriction endonuclease family
MADAVPVYTKEALTARLEAIAEMGWVPNIRHGNHGGIGNTLEQLLGIKENNLPIPNAAEWELKAQRIASSSLTTLFHMEPSPRAMRFVPQILLPKYGWAHQQAGERYGAGEMSFRQTIHGAGRSDRGFMVVIDRTEQRVLISFDAASVDPRHANWLASVGERGARRARSATLLGLCRSRTQGRHEAAQRLLCSGRSQNRERPGVLLVPPSDAARTLLVPGLPRRARTGDGAQGSRIKPL